MFQNDSGDNLVDDPDDSDECLDISEENTTFIHRKFIDLNHELLINDIDNNLTDEFVELGDIDFDIDEILNRVEK
ncbi:3780_t:CDS:2 [Entrophospora sp. SA101]|nr:4392_t:CDS:2 [Entrophospora sp. SA101]CAJ0846214.1 3780_t:CDS:2 [Entrophospora sp. SA101]